MTWPQNPPAAGLPPQMAHNGGYDDGHADYVLDEGEVLYGRFRVDRRIGRGSFGQVVRAWDFYEQREVAVKIIKNRPAFYRQAQYEIRLLEMMNAQDPENRYPIVRMLGYFEWKQHLCIVFELLASSLFELVARTHYRGVPIDLTRAIGSQLATTLVFLAQNPLNIIHCDLKPENVLFCRQGHRAIKVIDFGSSCQQNAAVQTYIQSRYYRAPEVLLGLPYNEKVDVWSMACVLVEVHTGHPLFTGSSEIDQMMKIIEVLGMPHYTLLDESPKTSVFFVRNDVGQYIPRQLVDKDGRPYLFDRTEITPKTAASYWISCKECWSTTQGCASVQNRSPSIASSSSRRSCGQVSPQVPRGGPLCKTLIPRICPISTIVVTLIILRFLDAILLVLSQYISCPHFVLLLYY
ncbi:hypothetical protein QR680_019123 [Steinernema hermaphroditum]|uniref:Protein kinase domain-containing protein n=1 Tax=Steinernema hermaphroditum TaxID=289476 RepID=A0AA39HL03_9BILA|nr:hypothetical protein QR680_019123 [Steinernema hermaphroditum]